MLNRIPVYPCIGNHDTRRREDRDDREQLLDNLYLRERIASDEASGRRRWIPGCSIVSATAVTSSSSASTRRRRTSSGASASSNIRSTGNGSTRRSMPDAAARWQFAFCHHPPVLRGAESPQHRPHGARCCRSSPACGVRVVSQRARAQLSAFPHNGIDYFVTGAGSKLDTERPDRIR